MLSTAKDKFLGVEMIDLTIGFIGGERKDPERLENRIGYTCAMSRTAIESGTYGTGRAGEGKEQS